MTNKKPYTSLLSESLVPLPCHSEQSEESDSNIKATLVPVVIILSCNESDAYDPVLSAVQVSA